MKKSIVALAVLTASGASFAQSNVTIYGIADIWFGTASVSGQESQTVLQSGGVSGSRWGLKGSEDLGGGLKANFQLENSFSLDTGTDTTGFTRQAYVGVSGGFGEVKLGNVYTAYDDISGAANAAFDSALAPVNGVTLPNGTATSVWLSTGYTSNPTNNIYYALPDFNGFTGAVSYALGENKTATLGASNVLSMNVQYAAGPMYVGFGYQNETPQGGGTSPTFTRLNGTYDLGAAKMLVGYGRVSDKNNAGVTTAGAQTTEWELGVDVPVSAALTVSAGYARSSDNVLAGDATRTGYAVAAAYSLSKRTTAYAGLHSDTTSVAGADTTGRIVALGLKHTF